jgi:hypothetical protein
MDSTHRYRRRRYLTTATLIVGMMTVLLGFAPVASAKPPPTYTPNSCSGSGCGPCPQGVTWHTLAWGFKVGYVYNVLSATPHFYVSDARRVDNFTANTATVTVTSSTSKTYTLTVTAGYSVDFLKVLHASVSVTITTSTTTAIGVSVQVPVPPFSSVLAEYGMWGYDTYYDVTKYITTSEDLSRNVCGNTGTSYNQFTIAPTYTEGWRITPV